MAGSPFLGRQYLEVTLSKYYSTVLQNVHPCQEDFSVILHPAFSDVICVRGRHFGINHYNICPYGFDSGPGNEQIIVPPQQAEHSGAAVQDHLGDLAILKGKVINAAKVFPCFQLNHIFLAQVTQCHATTPFPILHLLQIML